MKPTDIASATQLAVEGKDYLNFFEAFLDYLKIDHVQIQNYGSVDELGVFLPLLAKARTYAYLATTNDPQVSVGVAAKKDVWDFQHAAFREVREFLSRLGAP